MSSGFEWLVVVPVLAVLAGWAVYVIIRAAVRDGIRQANQRSESGRASTQSRD